MNTQEDLDNKIKVLQDALDIINNQEKLIKLLEEKIKLMEIQGQIIHYIPHPRR